MGLKEYTSKRKFHKTPEPKGSEAPSGGELRFVVQKHEASRLHYDFRLEAGGVLLSWAVPKGPSLNPADKHLAMQTEDHPPDYMAFEGVIPEDNYGAGNVMVWDVGTYHELHTTSPKESEKNVLKGLKEGKITVILRGSKLQGEFALVKLQNAKDENAWLLIKKDDAYADPKKDITKLDKSVLTNRTMAEIEKGKTSLEGAPKSAFPKDLKPMLATLTEEPFDNPAWFYEIKWDGYRIISELRKGKAELWSRNRQDYTEKYQPIADELAKIHHDVVLDGEVVVVDKKGKSHFGLLQDWTEQTEGVLMYYVFDILHLDGHDLTGLPLQRRKEILKHALPHLSRVKYSDHVVGDGVKFFEAVKKQGLEGMIAKDTNGIYLSGKRSKSWLKVKTHMRQEAVIAGWTEPRGSRKDIGALVLGVYENGSLIYIGHAGTGFGSEKLGELKKLLTPLKQNESPFASPPKTNMPATWVKPKVVCEVAFTEWTPDGSMRHPVFVGLREDKKAGKVIREMPEDVKPAETKSQNAKNKSLKADGHKLELTNLDKVYFPKDGFTKGDLVQYYGRVSEFILPYLKDRPESLHRHPNGTSAEAFFQKDFDKMGPDWIKTVPIYSESNKKKIKYLVCQNKSTLIYLAQLGCIEINPWNSRTQKLENPDWIVIDLDPEDIGFDKVIEVAVEVRKVLDEMEVESYPKTSGKTGLHIYIPLGAKYDYKQAKTFAEIIARMTNARIPKFTSVERSPARRQRKVYLDYLQNRKGQTLAAPYSVRPVRGAAVSTPLEWKEVRKGLDPAKFNIINTLKRLEKKGDIFKPVLGQGIDLKKLLASSEK